MPTGKRKWTYTLADIAVATQQSVFSVRRDQRKKLFRADLLESVALYVTSHILSFKAQSPEQQNKQKENPCRESPSPQSST